MNAPASSLPAPEFSRTVIAETVTTKGQTLAITPTEQERAALATRLGLVALDSLSATVRLRRFRGELIRVTGELVAQVVQSCVITLDPFPAQVSDEFSAVYAPDHLLPKEEDEEIGLVEDAEADVPEAMPNGRIDIGELVAQHLSLALDPYPRKPGVTFEPVIEFEEEAPETAAGPGSEPEAERENPFAALARFKRPS